MNDPLMTPKPDPIMPHRGDIWYILNKSGKNTYKIRIIGVDKNSVAFNTIEKFPSTHSTTIEDFLKRGTFSKEAGWWWRLWN